MTIFNYDDYRAYLNDLWKEKKAASSQYSFRAWSKKLRIDHTLFHKVLKGNRRLPQEKIERLGKELNLSAPELEYFQLMIDHGECVNKKLKSFIYQEMLLLKNQSRVTELTPDEFIKIDFYDGVLIELTEIPKLARSSEEISKKLNLSVSDIENRFERLVHYGFLQKQNGHYVKSKEKLKFKINFSQAEISHYFKEVNRQSNKHIDTGAPQKRAFRTRIVSISRDKGPLFAKMLDRFMQQLDEAFKDDKPKEIVTCMNLQLFPLWEETVD